MKPFILAFAATGLTLMAIRAQAQTTTDRKDRDKNNEHAERVENKAVLAKEVVVLKKEVRREEDEEIRREQHLATLQPKFVPNSVSGNHIRYGVDSYTTDRSYGAVPTTGETNSRQAPVDTSPNTEVMNHRHAAAVVAAPVAEVKAQRDVTVTNYNGAAEQERQQRLNALDKDFGPIDQPSVKSPK